MLTKMQENLSRTQKSISYHQNTTKGIKKPQISQETNPKSRPYTSFPLEKSPISDPRVKSRLEQHIILPSLPEGINELKGLRTVKEVLKVLGYFELLEGLKKAQEAKGQQGIELENRNFKAMVEEYEKKLREIEEKNTELMKENEKLKYKIADSRGRENELRKAVSKSPMFLKK